MHADAYHHSLDTLSVHQQFYPTVYLFYLPTTCQRIRLYRAPPETAGGIKPPTPTPTFIIIGGDLNYPTDR